MISIRELIVLVIILLVLYVIGAGILVGLKAVGLLVLAGAIAYLVWRR